MNMDGQKQTYEQFKADIFQWKDTHREEYRRFAKMMADGNEMQYRMPCHIQTAARNQKGMADVMVRRQHGRFQEHRPAFQG